MQGPGTFTAGNGVENDGSILLGAAQALIVNGAGLDNAGSFTIGAAGNLTLSTTAVNVNNGNFTLAPGAQLR